MKSEVGHSVDHQRRSQALSVFPQVSEPGALPTEELVVVIDNVRDHTPVSVPALIEISHADGLSPITMVELNSTSGVSPSPDVMLEDVGAVN
ncbi:hypothetical protein V6N13_016127 [Hibiscus sabdariffa]